MNTQGAWKWIVVWIPTLRMSECQKRAKLAFPPPSSFFYAKFLSNEPSRDFHFDREPSLGWGWSLCWIIIGTNIFYHANFASAIDSYGNFMVTLTMVPDRFESRATAHLIAFKQSEMMMVGGKPVLANLSTLTCVAKVFIIHYFTTAPASGIHAYTRQGLNCSTY